MVELYVGEEGTALHRNMTGKFKPLGENLVHLATWVREHLEISEKVVIQVSTGKKTGKVRGQALWPYLCRENELVVEVFLNSTFGRNVFNDFTNFDQLKSSQNYRTLLKVLCHEMVHASQFSRGIFDVKFINRDGIRKGVVIWDGVEWDGNKGKTYNSYRNLPWEVEAFDRDHRILDGYFRRTFLFAKESIKPVALSAQV